MRFHVNRLPDSRLCTNHNHNLPKFNPIFIKVHLLLIQLSCQTSNKQRSKRYMSLSYTPLVDSNNTIFRCFLFTVANSAHMFNSIGFFPVQHVFFVIFFKRHFYNGVQQNNDSNPLCSKHSVKLSQNNNAMIVFDNELTSWNDRGRVGSNNLLVNEAYFTLLLPTQSENRRKRPTCGLL